MRGLNLNNDADFSGGKFSANEQAGITRRHFMKGLGIVTATLALGPQDLLGQSSGSEAREWHDLVNNLVFSVADESQATTITSKLRQASIYYVSRGQSTFHHSFSSPYIFDGVTIDEQEVICHHAFQIVQLPYYDVNCPCRSRNDMNAAEIRTVVNPSEIKRFNCVLAPDGRRVPLDNNDHAEYVGRAAADYRLNLNEWEVPYKRRMVGGGRAHTGYQFVHKTQTNRHGRPKTDFIVSSDI